MDYKTIDDLMEHLKESGISISGAVEKQQLINVGYFHGYKGYRFFTLPANRIPFNSFSEVYRTIEYDSKLKSLLYEKVMFYKNLP